MLSKKEKKAREQKEEHPVTKGEELKEIIKELPPEKPEADLLKEELEEQKNKYLRALADFDNYKKRSQAERLQVIQFANENLIKELLPVVDNFSRAMTTAEKVEAHDELKKGLALVKKQIEDVLQKHGAEEILALGKPYDPNFHEAIMQKENEGPENIILEEVQKGYAFHGRVIRPSMVIVSKKKEDK